MGGGRGPKAWANSVLHRIDCAAPRTQSSMTTRRPQANGESSAPVGERGWLNPQSLAQHQVAESAEVVRPRSSQLCGPSTGRKFSIMAAFDLNSFCMTFCPVSNH